MKDLRIIYRNKKVFKQNIQVYCKKMKELKARVTKEDKAKPENPRFPGVYGAKNTVSVSYITQVIIL